MCVSGRGWMLALIATSREDSSFESSGSFTARTDSLLVRTSSPSRSLILRQRPAVLAFGEQPVGAEGASRQDDTARSEGPSPLRSQAPGRSVSTA